MNSSATPMTFCHNKSGPVHWRSPGPYPGRRQAAPAERSSYGHVLDAGIRTARGGIAAAVRTPSV
jgi:hypothetical protein